MPVVYCFSVGGGQYGDVYEAIWKKYNKTVAVKTLKVSVKIWLYFIAQQTPLFQIRKFFSTCYRWSKSVIEPIAKGYSVNSVEYGSSPTIVYHVTRSRSISFPSSALLDAAVFNARTPSTAIVFTVTDLYFYWKVNFF